MDEVINAKELERKIRDYNSDLRDKYYSTKENREKFKNCINFSEKEDQELQNAISYLEGAIASSDYIFGLIDHMVDNMKKPKRKPKEDGYWKLIPGKGPFGSRQIVCSNCNYEIDNAYGTPSYCSRCGQHNLKIIQV